MVGRAYVSLLGWKGDTVALTTGKIFVEGMTKAFFKCNLVV